MGAKKGNEVFGEPEEWEFDYPWSFVKTAFWLWAMSGFQRLPPQDEVWSYDPRYIDDMKLAHMLYAHQTNESPLMRIMEQAVAGEEVKKAYKEKGIDPAQLEEMFGNIGNDHRGRPRSDEGIVDGKRLQRKGGKGRRY